MLGHKAIMISPGPDDEFGAVDIEVEYFYRPQPHRDKPCEVYLYVINGLPRHVYSAPFLTHVYSVLMTEL